jgi:glyoxylase-like metal-dependent hydrolase (beta-lactamase superfamily II)
MYSKIEENIYCIPVTLPDSPLKSLNAYVVRGSRNLLIDTGYRRKECLDCLMEGLGELGISMDDTDIFLTHLHSDHTGLAPDIASPGTKIFIGREDGTRLMNRRFSPEKLAREHLKDGFDPRELALLPQNSIWKYSAAPRDDYILLDDGDTLSYGGRRLRLVLTPGHTPGHMCLWDDENQVLFLGDHVLYDISPNITTWPGFDDPLGRYVDSLVAVSAYPARIALPGHRGVSGTLSERVGAIIEHHGRRLREMLDALDACPGLTAWELAGKMSWNIRTDRGWEDFPPEQRWFAVSETDAHLEYLLRRGRVKCAEDGALLRYYSSK